MKNLKIKIQIILLIAIFFPINFVFADSSRVYILDLEYKNDTFVFNTVFTREVNKRKENIVKEGKFKYELISFNNKVLESGKFDIGKASRAKQFDLQSSVGDVKNNQFKSALVTLEVTYHKNGKTINIYNQDKKELEVDVSGFADTCGDAICQKYENFFNCKVDCAKKGDKPMDYNSSEIKNDAKKENKSLGFKIGLFILVLIALVVFGRKYYNKRKLNY